LPNYSLVTLCASDIKADFRYSMIQTALKHACIEKYSGQCYYHFKYPHSTLVAGHAKLCRWGTPASVWWGWQH